MGGKFKTTIVFDDEEYFGWIILITFDGEVMPIGRGRDTLVFSQESKAKKWVKEHSNAFY